MRASFVLPLCPLRDQVLLPGEELHLDETDDALRAAIIADRDFNGAVVTSLLEGDSVHEIGVTAVITDRGDDGIHLRGVARCRLLHLVDLDPPIVRAHRFPEEAVATGKAQALAPLLARRFSRLCTLTGTPSPQPHGLDPLSTVTWRVTAGLKLAADEQQGFLNVPDPVTRGKLLLLVVRRLEQRALFVNKWSHLRTEENWN